MIEVLYEDKNIVVCIKPVGISSEDKGAGSLPAILRQQLNCDIYPVHRLDQVVGGLIVYGKNSAVAGKLSSLTNEQFSKEYLAVCHGIVQPIQDTLVDLLYHDKSKNKTYVVDRKRAGVKQAKLDYEVIGTTTNKTFLKIHIFTGRTHQIRVQFAHRGHPLCGDGKYGSKDNQCSCALYCYKISFQHPYKNETRTLCHLPETKYPFSCFDLTGLIQKP